MPAVTRTAMMVLVMRLLVPAVHVDTGLVMFQAAVGVAVGGRVRRGEGAGHWHWLA